jgi:hypothetical protein
MPKGLIVTFSPTVIDSGILAIDVSGFVQPFVKRRNVLRECRSRCAVKKSDNRHRLLSMCNHRPNHGTTSKPHKLAASHLTPGLGTRHRPAQTSTLEAAGCDGPDVRLGQKRTCASHKPMSALHPIATAKADIHGGSARPACRANWSAYCPSLKRLLVVASTNRGPASPRPALADQCGACCPDVLRVL